MRHEDLTDTLATQIVVRITRLERDVDTLKWIAWGTGVGLVIMAAGAAVLAWML